MNVANLNAVLTLDASGFNNSVNIAITQINNIKNAAANTQNALKNMMYEARQISGLGRELTAAITVPIVGLGKEAIETAARFDRLKSALTAITGSADEATRQFARLNEIAKQPGIGIEEAVQGSINLQAVGMNANMAERAVSAFGNALVYSGRSKNELAEVETILSKIAGREILSERQFTGLSIRIPKMRQLLKEAFGTGDIQKIQQSGLPIDQILERFIYAAEQIPKVTGGIQNDIDNFGDNLKRSFDNIGQAMIPLVHKFTTEVGPAIERASKWFKGLNDEQKENVIKWGLIFAAIGPVLWGFGQMAEALIRIKTLMQWINTSQFGQTLGAFGVRAASLMGTSLAGGSLTLGGALGIGAAGALAGDQLAKFMDDREGKKDPGFMAMASKIPQTLADIFLRTMTMGRFGYDPDSETSLSADEKAELKARGDRIKADKSRQKPAGYGGLPDPIYTAEEQRNIYRAKLQSELETAKSNVSPDSTTPAQDTLKALGATLLKQAADLKKEAADMHISRKSTAKEWIDYYRIQKEAAGLESEMNRMQQQATKERDRIAKEARNANYRISEYNFHMREDDASAVGLNAPEGQKAQGVFSAMTPILKQRQKQLIDMWNMASADSANANEAAIRKAQIQAEYYSIEHKGAELQRAAANERLQNEKKAQQDRKDAFASYRQFQHERIRAMAEEAPNGREAETLLNAELPVLRAEQKEIMERQKEFVPNSKEYWDNARAYWTVEDQIHSLVKNAVKERHSAAQKAIEAQKQAATEQRELISLETRLMEARLKNNPFIDDTQRTQMMIPMLIKQYRQMMIPVAGESPIESMRRMLEAEGMKHDILQQAGALGRNNSYRTLGGGRIDNFNRRMLQNVWQQLDAPMSAQEQAGYQSAQKRAEQMAREAALGRPVVLQFNMPNNPDDVSREVWQALQNLNRGALPFPVRR